MLGILCIVGCPVQLIREDFWDCIFVVDTHLPRFEALAYVLIRASTRSVKFYFGLSMVRHCPWKMCATPGACVGPGCLARRPLCHKVNIPNSVARRPLCHKVNLPRYEARRRHFIMTCDIYGTGQTNSLGLCFCNQSTIAPLKSLKSTN